MHRRPRSRSSSTSSTDSPRWRTTGAPVASAEPAVRAYRQAGMRLTACIFAILLAVSACAVSEDAGGTPDPSVVVPADPSLEGVRQTAVADLARRLKVEPRAVEVVRSE